MLIVMTEEEEAPHIMVSARQERWADELVAGLTADAVEAAATILRTLQQHLGERSTHVAPGIAPITQDV